LHIVIASRRVYRRRSVGEVGYRPLDDGFRREHPVRRRLARSVKLKPRRIERAGARVPYAASRAKRFTVPRSPRTSVQEDPRNRRSVESAAILEAAGPRCRVIARDNAEDTASDSANFSCRTAGCATLQAGNKITSGRIYVRFRDAIFTAN
jgi:hypothetical protein